MTDDSTEIVIKISNQKHIFCEWRTQGSSTIVVNRFSEFFACAFPSIMKAMDENIKRNIETHAKYAEIRRREEGKKDVQRKEACGVYEGE